MRTFTYILGGDDGHEPIPEPNFKRHAEWTSENKFIPYAEGSLNPCQVALTRIGDHLVVSTVFLCFDMNWKESGPPITFETMVFHDGDEGEHQRYATWSEAEKGHALMVASYSKKGWNHDSN